YLATTTANVVSTAADAALSVADASATAPGHLVNGTFTIPSALQVHATDAAHPTTAFTAISGTPATLLTWPAPTSNDAVGVEFKQTVASGDALRSGSYSKAVVFTLSTTTP